MIRFRAYLIQIKFESKEEKNNYKKRSCTSCYDFDKNVPKRKEKVRKKQKLIRQINSQTN